MKCEIVKDLLPSYIDGLTSSVTNEEIEKHLDECDECRQCCTSMSEQALCMPNEVEKHVDITRKSKDGQIMKRFRRVRLKWIGISCTAVVTMIIIIFYILSLYIQLPYSQVQVKVEMQEPITDIVELDDGTSQTVRSTGIEVTEKVGTYGFTYPDFRYKQMIIDGKEKAVVFLNCQITIREYIFHQEVQAGTESVFVQGGYENKDFENADIIYYLDKGIEKIDNSSDDEVLEIIQSHGTILWEK